ncbi:MAG: NADPH:quinone oxidoreductase family protein [Chloroflexi bacterium]|nr:MAG: NADPH:quinone oxidoreductase family protein [Chloroflexota bacterium]
MRAQQIERLDGPDGLRMVDTAEPHGDDHVVIDVSAAGVSFPDLLMSRGLYQVKPPLPFVPGVEVAGTVRSAPAASGFTAGETVMAFTMLGGFAEVATADAAVTRRVPQQLSAEAAAGFLMNYHTAHFALARRAHVREGETVAVHGAGGGVGTAAVQVARGLGARVVAVVSSDEKAVVARRAGAHEIVDTRSGGADALRAVTEGRGADVILDPVGGDRFDESLRCLAPEGRLVVVGFTEGRIPSVQVNRLLFRNVSVLGAAWGAFLAGEPSMFASTQEALDEMIERGVVAPIVGATFPLEKAADALRTLEDRRAVGKVVLTVADRG